MQRARKRMDMRLKVIADFFDHFDSEYVEMKKIIGNSKPR